MSAPDEQHEQDEFAARMRELGELIEELERGADPKAIEPARALLRAALAVHERGLRALLDALRASAGPERVAWLDAACMQPSVSSLLLMHDLHPLPLATRVQRALDLANAGAHAGAHAALLAIEGEHVSVEVRTGRSEGAGANGASAADGASTAGAARLRRTLEALLCEHAPDAVVVLRGGDAARPEPLVPASRLIARIGGGER